MNDIYPEVLKYWVDVWWGIASRLMIRWGSSALASSLPSDGVAIKILVVIEPYTNQSFYEILQINEFNQGGPELPEGSVTVSKLPCTEVLQANTSGVGVSKLPRKTTTICTRRKTKTRTAKTLGESGRKMNT